MAAAARAAAPLLAVEGEAAAAGEEGGGGGGCGEPDCLANQNGGSGFGARMKSRLNNACRKTGKRLVSYTVCSS